jgi:hypothetical protein
METARDLVGGDIVLLPHGSAHVLHDPSGDAPGLTYDRHGSAGWMLSENDVWASIWTCCAGDFLPGRRMIGWFATTCQRIQWCGP